MANRAASPYERQLPVPQGRRTVTTKGPRQIQLGRTRRGPMGAKWQLLCAAFVASAVLYGAIVGGQIEKIFNATVTGAERAAVAMGFGVKRVVVEGQRNATDFAITTALGAGPETFMLAFDTDAAKDRLEAVPWIRHARVMRLLPSTLQVEIEERDPYAIWQNKRQTFVVDSEGVVLAPALPQAFPHLPLVVGEGAGKHAAALYQTLEPYTDLKSRMLAALRVGDRRWTLKLRTGTEVMLPDGNIEMALEALQKLERERGVFEQDIAAIDMRLLDRITLRLRETAAASAQDTTTPAGVPTSATGTINQPAIHQPNGRT
ncbi:cell division protein FtsQ/DivIB [Methyloceanibacter caenitepidi]|uniref:Cell division protein FtsQ n=1 Tax=Methyloceanibacter caenitepidi TaxID=1384459 RepID=A0A0A8K2N0_9HYPH|nr:cell division protein FtsQ/DivIB [Methyloceanibacter caenitepidi]BAQ17036.1 cell division protein FtsQ [Methyloceanibacter caenitepidi]